MAENGLGKLKTWLDANGFEQKALLRRLPNRCHFHMVQSDLWGRSSEEWNRISGWHDGRWTVYLENFRPVVHAGKLNISHLCVFIHRFEEWTCDKWFCLLIGLLV